MKNAIFTFICALVPGAGQMYQGYMKRGLTLITLFCLGFGCACVSAPLVVSMLIVWMYSFFDTFNLRAQIGTGTAPEDDYLVHLEKGSPLMQSLLGQSHKLLGWGLIVFGAVVFYQNILMNTLGDIMWRWGQNNVFLRAVYLAMDSLPEIAVCVALVACGVWLVRGPRGAKRAHDAKAEQTLPDELLDYSYSAPETEASAAATGEEAADNGSANTDSADTLQ